MSEKQIKTCLVVSYGPVPTPQYQTIEGGGMRAWGLAKGLQANGVEATVGINASFPQEINEHEGVRIVNWAVGGDFAELINSFDAVIISYCMGSESVFVADNIKDDVLLILDAYVPIYVEVSARKADDIDNEYHNYMADIERYNRVLKRGDYFLCASKSQKSFYIGVLSGLGIINPLTYHENRIIIAPFGIHDLPPTPTTNPFLDLNIKKSDFVAMWFGGLYPWFRIQELLEAILKLSSNPKFKFVIVGGKNPFNPNPDLARQYDITVKFAKKHNLTGKSLFFVDWVDFDTRINWFHNADVVVSLNQPGEENGFSWRTRVMDFVWGELAIVTNGGDPLSEDLLAEHAAIKLDNLSASEIADKLAALQNDPSALKTVQNNIRILKPKYFWHSIMAPVADAIRDKKMPYKEETVFRKNLLLGPIDSSKPPIAAQPSPKSKLGKVIHVSRRMYSHARRKGLKRSARLGLTILKTQLSTRRPRTGKQFIFISHPINHTGAPLVLLDIVEEYAKRYGPKNVRLVAPATTKELARRIRLLGIRFDKAAMGIGFRIIGMQFGLHKDDFLLMNTIAIYENYRNFVIHALETGKLNHAYWFIHEDIAQLAVISQELLLNKHLHKRICVLIEQGKLTIIVPSHRVKQDYDNFFKTNKVSVIPLLVTVPAKYQYKRPASDYNEINILLSGTASDGRKGQLIAIAAINEFTHMYQQNNPNAYRPFKLHLVAIGDDYVSQQIKIIGQSLLGDKLILYPAIPKEEAMRVTSECNAVICCSLNETFGLYITEGMLMGHVVLRNDSAGMEEQLQDGKNGYYIDTADVSQIAAQIEKLLNKKTHPNDSLRQMGELSQVIAKQYTNNEYLDHIESIT